MSETLPIGAQVAGYRISGTLGRGGMGFVYDAGDAGGVVYIAMRYVAGGDLAQLVESGTLELERALDILEQVAGALDAAHANELVHRDVKPANVLVEAEGRVYLTDFGIAKRARSKGVTQTGFFVGTLDYEAPEQIRGESLGAPADVYAFGCLVFESLTGKKPFERDTDVAVMYAQLRDDPPSASELRPELPASVDAVVARALAKEEDGRYRTCRELVEGVRACLGGLAPATSAAVPAPVADAAAVTNMPVPPTPLIGRDVELLALVEAAEPELLRANQVVWLERLDVEHDNIRAALAWATAAGEVELALRLAGALVRFWSTRGLMREGRTRLAGALASPEGVAPALLA